MFAVVRFIIGDTVEWCPTAWLVGRDKVQWPPKWISVTAFRKKREKPTSEWLTYDIKVMGVYGTNFSMIKLQN